MKLFMYISVSIMCLVIMLVIGIYIGGQLAQARPPAPEPTWCDSLMDANGARIANPGNLQQLSQGVPVEWLLYQATYFAGQGTPKYMKIYVTTGESPNEEYLDPNRYHIYIEGWDSEKQQIRCLDRVPVWP